MILGFADETTRDIHAGKDTKTARKVPKILWSTVHRKLDMLEAAHQIKDLQAPPGNRLEKLRGDRAGFWSIRVNDQYRIVFTFENGNADAVQIVDYH